MKRIYILPLLFFVLFLNSCINDLDTEPIDPNIVNTDQVYSNQDNYKGILAKCYAALCLSGQQGPTGDPDIGNFDEGYRRDNEIDISNNFDISTQAVKKQARAFKSVLKLDKNFHIYIHGDKELIEQGVEKDGRKYYKIYYKDET